MKPQLNISKLPQSAFSNSPSLSTTLQQPTSLQRNTSSQQKFRSTRNSQLNSKELFKVDLDKGNVDDSFHETNMYLTQQVEGKEGLKRTQTANPNRRSQLGMDSRNFVQKKNVKVNQIKSKSSTNLLKVTEKDFEKYFLRQSVIAKSGLQQLQSDFEVLEFQDIREAQHIFLTKNELLLNENTEEEKKTGVKVREILKDQVKGELSNSLMNYIYLHQYIFKYVEIKLKGHNKPLFLFFNYPDQMAKFKFFISRFTYTPNIFNCEEVFNKKTLLKYNEPGDQMQFQSDSVYLAIHSTQQTTIQIKVQFGSGIKRKFNEDIQKESTQPEHNMLYDIHLKKQIELIKNKKQESQINLRGQELMQSNFNMKQYIPQNQEKVKKIRRIQSATKISEVIDQKKILDDQKKQNTIMKWQHSEKVKILREIFRHYLTIEEVVENQQKTWLRWLKYILQVKDIRTMLYQAYAQKAEQKFKTRIRNKIRCQIRQFQKIKGENINIRTNIDTTQAIQMMCRNIKKRSKQRGCQLVVKFMKSYGVIGGLVQKILQIQYFSKKVKDCWRHYKKRVRGYNERIARLWFKNWQVSYHSIMKDDIIKTKEIQKKRAKDIIGFHVDEEIKQAPVIESQITNIYISNIQQALDEDYSIILQNYKRAILKIDNVATQQNTQLGSISQLNRIKYQIRKADRRQSMLTTNVLSAAQVIGGDNSELNNIKLFQPITKEVINDLIYQYMLYKKMLQSQHLEKALNPKQK